ncbi:methionine synthase [Microbispora sp. ATCC PTA-5024]|uniref:methionine synthase n=1 Tax=Microbispora sp. ATCC PTA-5024 TaxID=316330 RepID=UPI0003DBBAE4|nr:methionine synthase [Microbispora sp. ATCC PTA-5024]ETK31826.1 vitamin-B12 independent methionine synthase [Microbispora sp. ATCC PTA-5024]
MNEHPWSEATATGVGSYPGDDHVEALRTAFGELPMPYLPELPARGVGADMIGRTAALLVELPVEVQPSGWRLTDRPGRDLKRALDHLRRDLDGLEEVSQGYEGPLKIQACGPWTLAGAVELRYGDKVLADPGAVRDLAESLAEGLAQHVADVRRRVPGARLVVQLDEPGLPGVLAGTVPTASGFGRLAAVEAPVARERLQTVIDALAPAFPIVHCCAPDVPFEVLRTAGARGVSLDVARLRRRDEDQIGETVEAGVALFLGVVPGTGTRLPDKGVVAKPATELWRRLGFAPAMLADQVVLTPACGLAGASPAYARAALARCREAALVLREDPGE